MATFDEVARQTCKVDGPALIGWLDRFADESMASDFASWDDTRRTSWPGGPERIDDVVCILRRQSDREPAYLIVEAETEPRPNGLARMGIYELLLAIEVRAVLADGPRIYGAIIHLTGSRKDGPLILTRSASSPGVLVKPIEVWLADQSAADTLDLIDSGELGLCILPWVVLMGGGGDLQLIDRWKRLAEREADLQKRGLYGAFALVFAELIPELVNWQRGLEGWQMREPQFLKSIEKEGEVKRARADILRGLPLKLKSPVPEPIRLAIEGTNDLDTLDRWFQAMFTVDSWPEFEKQMKQSSA